MASTSSTTASRLGCVTSLVGGGRRSSSQACLNARRPLLGLQCTRSPHNASPYEGHFPTALVAPACCHPGCSYRRFGATQGQSGPAERTRRVADCCGPQLLNPLGSSRIAIPAPSPRGTE